MRNSVMRRGVATIVTAALAGTLACSKPEEAVEPMDYVAKTEEAMSYALQGRCDEALSQFESLVQNAKQTGQRSDTIERTVFSLDVGLYLCARREHELSDDAHAKGQQDVARGHMANAKAYLDRLSNDVRAVHSFVEQGVREYSAQR